MGFSFSLHWIFVMKSDYDALGPPLWSTIPLSYNYSRIDMLKFPSLTPLEMTKKRIPLVLTNSPAAHWKDVAGEWQLHNLAPMSRKENILEQCRVNTVPLFVLERDRDIGGMIGEKQHLPVLYKNVSLDLFHKTSWNNKEYYYWTGKMSTFSSHDNPHHATDVSSKMPTLHDLSRTSWSSFHVVEPELSEGLAGQGSDFWEPMLWLSQPGVVAQTHFDLQHNFFTTIFGVRRFTFFPPTYDMNLYPNIHRSFRQSQLRLEGEQDAMWFMRGLQNMSKKEIYQIDLLPGETLYIPPYWYHRVETLTPSLGVSVNSPSALEAILQQAFWQPVPLGAFRTTSQKNVAVKVYLEILVEKICGISLSKFSDMIYTSRYSLLFSRQWMARKRQDISCHIDEKLCDESLSKFHSTADSVASIVASARPPTHVRSMFMGDYIEQMTRWTVGPNRTGLYIYHCLANSM